MSIKYKRPSGTEIEVADTGGNKAVAAQLGWKEVKEVIVKPESKPKPKRKAAKDGRDS